MKSIAFLLLLFLAGICRAETYVLYINGAMNSSASVRLAAQEKFKIILETNGLIDSSTTKGLMRSTSYIPYDSGPFSSNPLLVRFQQGLSAEAFRKTSTNPSSINIKPYFLELGKLYEAQLKIIDKLPFMYQSGIFFTSGYASSIEKIISDGHKLIIVSHSQGNLYSEAAFSVALARGKVSSEKLFNSVKMIGLGSVSATTKDNKYITIIQDKTVDGIGGIPNESHAPFKSLSANFDACFFYCFQFESQSTDVLDKKTGGSNAHGAKEIYLNENISVRPINSNQAADKSIVENLAYMIRRSWIEIILSNKRTSSINIVSGIGIAEKGSSKTYAILSLFGIRSAFAQTSSSLFAYINQSYTVRVDGAGFDGNEAVSIDGSNCDKSTIQRGSGYFTQSCTGGSVAGDANKIRVYDTQYDLDIEIPTAYQTMQLRGPVIAPLAPALSEPTSGTIRLSWGAVSGATGYEISRTGQTLTTVGAITSYDDTGRTPGTMYCYRLRTFQNGTMSAYSPESCLTVNTLKCQGQWTSSQYNPGQTETRTLACQSGYAGNISQTHTCQATGQWGATSENNTCTIAPVASCTGSWSSAKYLVGQIEEKYENTCPAGTQGQVRSWHTCLASGTSAVWGGLAQSDNCTAYLASPTNLALSSVIGGMQLSWSPASGATRYYIYKNGDANNYYSSVTGTSWIDANVVNGQSYSYALKAYSNLNNSNVYSPITSWVSKTFEAGNLTIDPPQNVTASRFTDGYGRKSIRLTWSTVPSVDSYYIYRRGYVNPNGNGEFLAAINGVLSGATPEFMDYAQLNLISGNSYCYYIRAASGNNQSVNSYPDACSYAP